MKIGDNEINIILADLNRSILFIPKNFINKINNLGTTEATLYRQYKNRYPNFKEEYVNEKSLIAFAAYLAA